MYTSCAIPWLWENKLNWTEAVPTTGDTFQYLLYRPGELLEIYSVNLKWCSRVRFVSLFVDVVAPHFEIASYAFVLWSHLNNLSSRPVMVFKLATYRSSHLKPQLYRRRRELCSKHDVFCVSGVFVSCSRIQLTLKQDSYLWFIDRISLIYSCFHYVKS